MRATNAEEFADALAPYLAVSRPTQGRADRAGGAGRPARRTRSGTAAAAPAAAAADGGDVDAKAVRAWAQTNGVAVSPRGRLSGTVIEQYRAAR